MGSPTQGMWTCRHGVDGRDYCEACHAAPTAGDWRRADLKAAGWRRFDRAGLGERWRAPSDDSPLGVNLRYSVAQVSNRPQSVVMSAEVTYQLREALAELLVGALMRRLDKSKAEEQRLRALADGSATP